MSKKILAALAVIVLVVGIITSLYASYECKKAYTKCTEGACGGELITAESCYLDCTKALTECSEVKVPQT